MGVIPSLKDVAGMIEKAQQPLLERLDRIIELLEERGEGEK